MKKIISVLVGAAAFALPFAALAAPSVTNLTFSGSPNVSASAGSSVDATVWATLSGSDAINSVSYEFPGSGLPFTCVAINPVDINPGQYNIDLPNFTVPNEAGNWDVTIKTYSDTFPAVDSNCDVSGLKTTHTFSDVVNIPNSSVSNSNSNSTGQGSTSTPPFWFTSWLSAFQAQIAALIAGKSGTGGGTGTGTVSAACQEFNADVAASVPNSVAHANVILQGFLLAKGESIPALAAGAAFGFDGPQTQAASAAYKAQAGC